MNRGIIQLTESEASLIRLALRVRIQELESFMKESKIREIWEKEVRESYRILERLNQYNLF